MYSVCSLLFNYGNFIQLYLHYTRVRSTVNVEVFLTLKIIFVKIFFGVYFFSYFIRFEISI
jgi:hypothetical protein